MQTIAGAQCSTVSHRLVQNCSVTGMDAAQALDLIEQALAPDYLNSTQKLIFQQVWLGKSYNEIATASGYDYGYVKDTGAQVWRLLSPIVGQKVTKGNVRSRISTFLKHRLADSALISQSASTESSLSIEPLYGRTHEVNLIQTWLTGDRCRLISIHGLSGIGKTSLTAHLTSNVETHFDYIIRRSVRHAPPLNHLLTDILLLLSKQITPQIPQRSASQIPLLLDYFRQKHCLLVLDNVEAILRPGVRAGIYRSGYEDYGELITRIAAEPHQSCLLITSREQPSSIAIRVGSSQSIRSLKLAGLDPDASQSLLQDQGLTVSPEQSSQLTQKYSGHPLALQIVTSTIHQIFGGSIEEFLAYGSTVFGDLWDLLEQQFQRLSKVEQHVMYWLALKREWADIAELRRALIPTTSPRLVLEAIESLNARSLIEITHQGISQQPMVMEYMTERLINQFYDDLQLGRAKLNAPDQINWSDIQDPESS